MTFCSRLPNSSPRAAEARTAPLRSSTNWPEKALWTAAPITILRTGSPSASTPVSLASVSSICRYHLRTWNSPKFLIRITQSSADKLVDRLRMGLHRRAEWRPGDRGDLRKGAPFPEPARAAVDRAKQIAVLGAGKEKHGIGGVHAERPEGGIRRRVQEGRRPGRAAIHRPIELAAGAGRSVADGEHQDVAAGQGLDGARVVHVVEAALGGDAGPGPAVVGAGEDRVDGQHEGNAGLLVLVRRQDGDRVDIGTADRAVLVDPLPGRAVVEAPPGAALLDAEPDLGAVDGIDADREDARPIHPAAKFGNLGRKPLPVLAAIGRAEHGGTGGRAGAGIDVGRIERIDGDRPHG